ncbi:unnamed protein product, partial [Callosobruchus maculatus]
MKKWREQKLKYRPTCLLLSPTGTTPAPKISPNTSLEGQQKDVSYLYYFSQMLLGYIEFM